MTSERGDILLLTAARLNRWASRHAELPAPAAQLRLLSLLGDLGPSRIGDLAQADNSSQPTMTTQVQRLEALGLVERHTDERDGRATVISMTDAGRTALLKARQARSDVVQPLLDGLTPDELATIDGAVEIIDNALLAARGGLGAPTV